MYVFELKKSVVLDAPTVLGAFLVFSKDRFSLAYGLHNRPADKYLKVMIELVDKQTLERRFMVTTFDVSVDGFWSGEYENGNEVLEWRTREQELRADIGELERRLAEFAVERERLMRSGGEGIEEVESAIQVMEGKLSEKRQRLAEMGEEPVLVEKRTNRYDDVIKFFNKDGTLTEEGIRWAKRLPFLEGTFDDYVNFSGYE